MSENIENQEKQENNEKYKKEIIFGVHEAPVR